MPSILPLRLTPIECRPQGPKRSPIRRPSSLAPSAGLTRSDLVRPSAQTTVNPSASISTISPILPPMPFGGSPAGSGFASKICNALIAKLCPRAGRGIAAADEVVDPHPRACPVDARIVRRPSSLISRERLILLQPWRLAGFHEIDGLEHRLDPHREKAIEIDGTRPIPRADRRLFLQEHIARVETIVGPKIQRPVSSSPLMIGQLIALGPRYRGRREGWYWIEPCVGMFRNSSGTKRVTKAMT